VTCCLHLATRFSRHSNGYTRPISYMEITVLFSNMMSNRWIHFHFHLSQCPGSKTIKVNQNSPFSTTCTLAHSTSSSWPRHKTITKHHHSTLSWALVFASLHVRGPPLLQLFHHCSLPGGFWLASFLHSSAHISLRSLYSWMPGTGCWGPLGLDQAIAVCGYYNQQLLWPHEFFEEKVSREFR